jgi:hypothetical protein
MTYILDKNPPCCTGVAVVVDVAGSSSAPKAAKLAVLPREAGVADR